ncbi:hypothetical protein GCM10025778_26940 [Paeniglutamicibacter antarcticus]|uniref:Amino acid permease-like protein n=1 Tax=Paeniglutamicibacter antarcticus TaxID=494023 RepID=A0ABP9TP42_9MICC
MPSLVIDVVATSAEEVKDPNETLPRGIFAGLALTTVLCVGVSLALGGMPSYEDLAGVENPNLATAFSLVGNEGAASVITVGSLIGLSTVVMVLLRGLSRVVLAMSRDGLLPPKLSVTGPSRGTPVRIQIPCGSLVAVAAGFTRLDVLEEMINIGTLSAFGVVSCGIIVLRRKRPDLQPLFRVPFGPLISALLCTYPDAQPCRGDLALLRGLVSLRCGDLLRVRTQPLALEPESCSTDGGLPGAGRGRTPEDQVAQRHRCRPVVRELRSGQRSFICA